MEISEPKTKEDFERYYNLRWRVLRAPWKQPVGSEKDKLEDDSIHIMACEGGELLGVGRLHFNSSEEAQVRYMAVEEDARGNGIGTAILRALEDKSKEKGANFITLNARDYSLGFYKTHGYHTVGKAHTLFEVIPHFKMRKELA